MASSDRFQFIGNVTIGDQIKLASMKRHYDALLFAYGASKDRLLGVPGESTLKGLYSAREFVGWYNGQPEYSKLSPNLDAEHAVVIGNGNVALDVARILLSTVDSLRKTDITDSALDALAKSRVKRVTIAGRRGPMQAAFTIKELRELINLPNTSFQADNMELIPSTEWTSKLPRLEQRKYRFAKLLTAGARDGDRQCHLRSLISPEAFISHKDDGLLSHIRFRHNAFRNDNQRFDSDAQIKPADEHEILEADLAFRSIGYKAVPIPGLGEDLELDFREDRGIIANDGLGRALHRARYDQKGSRNIAAGCYCTGWVKNGPTGVIATTMEDAFATADAIVDDWGSRREKLCDDGLKESQGWQRLREEVATGNTTSWEDWRSIDRFEKQVGQEKGGKPRSKLRDVAEMMTAAKLARSS